MESCHLLAWNHWAGTKSKILSMTYRTFWFGSHFLSNLVSWLNTTNSSKDSASSPRTSYATSFSISVHINSQFLQPVMSSVPITGQISIRPSRPISIITAPNEPPLKFPGTELLCPVCLYAASLSFMCIIAWSSLYCNCISIRDHEFPDIKILIDLLRHSNSYHAWYH